MGTLPRVIVTGGSGFLGRRLVGSLLGRARVVGIDRRPRAEAYVPDHENMSWFQIDLGDAAAVEETFAEIRAAGRVDAFIHLAAYYDFTGEEHPEYERTNVAGLGHVLDACRTLGLRRFVFASSAGVARVRRDRTPLDEDAPADGEHVYARSKSAGERLVRERSRDFPAVIVRLGALFSDWCEFPPLYFLLETWLSDAWNARVLGGRGETSTPYLHVRDAVSFFLRLLERMDGLERCVTLLGSADGAVSHRELFEAATAYAQGSARAPLHVPALLAGPGIAFNDLVGRLRGERPFERTWMARYIDTFLWVDASRTRRILDWEPHARLGLLNRVPYMIENKHSDSVEWQRRNAEALEHHLVHPNYAVFRIVRRHAAEIAAAHVACFQGPAADPALARYGGMKTEDREYHSGLLLRNLMDAVRTGTKGGFMAFCRNLAEHRHRQGFRVEDLVASLQALRRVSLEVVGRDPEAVRFRQAIHNYLGMTVEFGIDQVLEVFEEHEIGALPAPEEWPAARS